MICDVTASFLREWPRRDECGVSSMHAQVVHKLVHSQPHRTPQKLPYLLLRGDIFYFRFKVPLAHQEALSRREIRLSLRTDSVKRARLLVQSKLRLINEIKRCMSKDKELLIRLYEELSDFQELEGLNAYQRASFAEGSQAVADEIRSSISDGLSYDLDEYLSHLKSRPAGAPSHDYLSLLIELLELRSERAYSGISPQLMGKHQDVKRKLEYLTGGTVAKPVAEPVEVTPLLSEVWKDFRAERMASSWDESKVLEQDNIFDLNINVLGDKPVGAYTKKDMHQYMSILRRLPKLSLKAYKNLSMSEVIEIIDDVDKDDRIKSKTAKEKYKQLQGIFSSYLTNQLGVLERSPTSGVTVPSDGEVPKVYPPFSVGEAKKILEHIDVSEALQPYEKWYLRLAFFSGMRAGEIRAVTKANIKQDHDSGVCFIFIPDAKTPAGVRKVPVHKYLLDKGFIDFCEGSTEEGFLDIAVNKQHHYLKLLRKICGMVGVPVENDYGVDRVFHSIRHTVITQLTAKSVSDPVLQSIVGHQISNRGLTSRYTHKDHFPMELLKEAIDKISY